MGKRKFTVAMDQGLYDRAREQLPPDVSLSAMLSDAVRAKLGEIEDCPHEVLRCTRCGERVENAVVAAEA